MPILSVHLLALFALVLSLVGCQAADPFANPPAAGTTGLAVTVYASNPQLRTTNSDKVTITAAVVDANNVALPGKPVTFAATSGVLSNAMTVTDDQGFATADLTLGSDPTVRTITVTATSGQASASYDVEVSGTQLSISGPTTMSPGSAVFTITAKDGAGTPIPNRPITVSSSNPNNSVNPTSGVTDNSGVLLVTLTASQSGSVTASGLGLQATRSVTVSADSFSVTAPAAPVNVKTGCAPVTATWTSSGMGLAGKTILFSATRGLLYDDAACSIPASTTSTRTALTNASGVATLYVQSDTAGPSTITAIAQGGPSASGVMNFIATVPDSIVLSADKNIIPPNGTASLTAFVKDLKGNLVSNAQVTFSLSGDQTGATLSGGGLTDIYGQASATFQATATSSSNGGIQVTAEVLDSTLALVNTDTVSLTVGQQGLSISISLSNKIASINNETTYELPGMVQVIDAAGNPVAGMTVTLQAVPSYYTKGVRVWSGTEYVLNESPTIWYIGLISPQYLPCINEDLIAGNAANGQLEAGEDFNGDGMLQTGFVATVTPSVVTDVNGVGQFKVYYGKDYANWVQVRLIGSAGIAGSDSSKATDFVLPASAADLKVKGAAPGMISPFGGFDGFNVVGECTDPF